MCCACVTATQRPHVCTAYVYVEEIKQGRFGLNNIYDLLTRVEREAKGFQAKGFVNVMFDRKKYLMLLNLKIINCRHALKKLMFSQYICVICVCVCTSQAHTC